MRKAHSNRHYGFTMIEALLASVVLSVSVAAISQVVVAGQMQTVSALDGQRAVSLAQALLEEILAKPYWDPDGVTALGPEGGELFRALFDNCDDYSGYTESAGAVTDVAGVVYGSGYERFSRTVIIENRTTDYAELTNKAVGITVTVRVTDTKGESQQVVRFIPEADY